MFLSVTVGQSHSLEWPTSDEEWISLTRRHLESHEAEKQQWLDVLATLFTTLEQVWTCSLMSLLSCISSTRVHAPVCFLLLCTYV